MFMLLFQDIARQPETIENP